MLEEFHARLGEDFMVLLPETIPFLAELMEGEVLRIFFSLIFASVSVNQFSIYLLLLYYVFIFCVQKLFFQMSTLKLNNSANTSSMKWRKYWGSRCKSTSDLFAFFARRNIHRHDLGLPYLASQVYHKYHIFLDCD